MACCILSLVHEWDVKRKERINIVTSGRRLNDASILSAVSAVRGCLFDRNNQVREQGCLSRGCGRCSLRRRFCSEALIDSGGDSGRVIWGWRRPNRDSRSCYSVRRRGRKRSGACNSGADGAGGDEGFLGDAGIVFAHRGPRIASFTVLIGHTSDGWRWWDRMNRRDVRGLTVMGVE